MNTLITAERYHDISCGHRVYGHEGKCRFMHGHNYRVHFSCVAPALDKVGRIIDFSVMKELLCQWLEENYDHRFLIWEEDPLSSYLKELDSTVVLVPYNPTAENIASFLLSTVGPMLLKDTEVDLVQVTVEETRKCRASALRQPARFPGY